MATEKDGGKKDPDLGIVENEDGSAVIEGLKELSQDNGDNGGLGAESESAQKKEDAQEVEGVVVGGDEDLEDDEVSTKTDAELAGAANEEERERIRAQRRDDRVVRRQRRKDAALRHQRELQARDQLIDQMRLRLQALERSNAGADVARVDARIRQEEANIASLKAVIADAAKVSNGEAVAEATVRLSEAMLNKRELDGFRKRVQRTNETPEAPQLDPRMVAQAASWMEDNKWYNPQGADSDSRQVIAIDTRLYEEGFDPKTPAYWDELSRRVRQTLPHRARSPGRQNAASEGADTAYNAAGQRRPPQRSVVTGSGAENGGASNGASRSGFLLSPARVQALKDAGMWDNPTTRDKAIREYREYDARAASEKRASSR
jgi:hypothetical protein